MNQKNSHEFLIEQENELRTLISSMQIERFLISFNLYFSNRPNTSDTLLFKAVALLCYLSMKRNVEFYELLQSIQQEDLSNANIQFVLRLCECMSHYDTEALRKLYDACGNDFKNIMKIILDNVMDNTESTLKQDIRSGNGEYPVKNSHLEDIKDTIFFIKNFAGN